MAAMAERGVKVTATARPGSAFALCIGNTQYAASPLLNAANDAQDVAALCTRLGFSTQLLLQASLDQMLDAVDAFAHKLQRGGVALFFFAGMSRNQCSSSVAHPPLAGHGIEDKGQNYLIPTEYKEEDSQRLDYKALKASSVLEKLEGAGCHLNLVVLDACRAKPLPARGGARALSRGLAKIEAPAGTLVAFACAPGHTASDGNGRNGVFTESLLRHLGSPGLDIDFVMRAVVNEVEKATKGAQVPFRDSSLKVTPCCLIEAPSVVHPPARAPAPALDAFLSRCDVEDDAADQVAAALKAMGVSKEKDLALLTEEDFASLKLPSITARKLRGGLAAISGGALGVVSVPPSPTPPNIAAPATLPPTGIASTENKKRANVVFFGHANSGKSKTISSLKTSLAISKPLLGRSIDYISGLETSKSLFTLIDIPSDDSCLGGFSRFGLARCGVLVIDATPGLFEKGMDANGQTREHSILAITSGVNELIVAVNKMDVLKTPYSQARYDDITVEVKSYLKIVGYNPDNIPFIPISAQEGDNIKMRSFKMNWYKGPTLMDALDQLKPPRDYFNKPLRLSILDVSKVDGTGTVLTGFVMTGILKVNLHPVFAGGFTSDSPKPSTSVYIKSVVRLCDNTSVTEAMTGDIINFHISNSSVREFKLGMVMSGIDDPVKNSKSFVAQVIIMNHPGQIGNGYSPIVLISATMVAVKFAEILAKVDRRTGQELEKFPKAVKNGDACFVRMIPTKPMCVESFADYPPLGRFAVRDSRQTIAVGVVKSVET